MRTTAVAVLLVGLFVSEANGAAAPAPRRRVAVLAFKNLRADADTDWIGAALLEERQMELHRSLGSDSDHGRSRFGLEL